MCHSIFLSPDLITTAIKDDSTVMIKKKVTIDDVAEIANVSIRTVSRVINNSPRVGKATREKIQKIIDDLDYLPNAQARGLAAHLRGHHV